MLTMRNGDMLLAMPAALLPEFSWRYPAAARWLRDLAEMRQVGTGGALCEA